jgi:imidazolonepropionase-like amidohydrolase
MTRTRSAISIVAAAVVAAACVTATPARAQGDSLVPSPAALSQRTVIRVAHVLEPRTGKRIDNAVIVIDSGRITSVTSGGKLPYVTRMYDLGNATVLPGLIDVHTHLSGESHDYYTDLFRHSPIDAAVRAHVYAKRTLEAGFTTVRDVGAPELIDVALRNAINEGVVEGPRMLVATLALSATGGHGDLNGFSPYIHFQQMSNIADGVDEVRKAVRVNVKYGADWIKVLASAGVLSEEEAVGAPQYSQEELNAIVAEATTWGRKVAAHAHGAEAIKRATRAGVASIEHGGLVDEEGVRLMKEHGTYLVPDIYTDAYILEHGKELGLPDKMIEKERQLRKAQNVNWRRAIAAGVKMAFGTDAGVYPHGTNARQFKYLLELGLTPLQTIQMATSNAADLLGWSDKVGTLAPGAWADLIAVRGDPLNDVTVLERPAFVMKGGTVYRSAAAADSGPTR